jgi:hypothetical protein
MMKRKSTISIFLTIILLLQVFSPVALAASDPYISNSDMDDIIMIYENSTDFIEESFWMSDTYRYLYSDFIKDDTVVLSYTNNSLEITYNDGKALYEGHMAIDEIDYSDLKVYINVKDHVLNNRIKLELIKILDEEKVVEGPRMMSFLGAFEFYQDNVTSEYLDKYIGSSTYNGKLGYVYEGMYHTFDDLGVEEFKMDDKVNTVLGFLKITEPKLLALGFVLKIVGTVKRLAQPYTIVRYRGTQNFVRDVTIDGIIRYEEGKYIRHYVYSGYDYVISSSTSTQDANFSSVSGLVRQAVINMGW